MNTALIRFTLLSSALLTVACTDEETDPGAQEFRTTWYCDNCGIGSNSPRFDDYDIPELHLDGLANDDGVTLRGVLSPGGTLYRLDVINDNFVARNALNQIVATKQQLVGWKIALRRPGTSVDKLITINAYEPELASWATPGDSISAYSLSYVPADGSDPLNVCPDFGADQVAVTLIGGETYNSALKTVNANMTRWVTIACFEQAVYKMKRLGYGPNQKFNAGNAAATVAQRQATLKMITADYCGTGVSYTEQGTPLYWNNAADTVNTHPMIWLPPAPEREARWNSNGATCLSTPRYFARADVACANVLPLCDNTRWAAAAEWSTWTP